MSKTYTVRCGDSGERAYELHELIWLWRTAQLPHDAQWQGDSGEWKNVAELVEPMIVAQDKARLAKGKAPPRQMNRSRIAKFAVVTVGGIALLSTPYALDLMAKRKATQIKEARIAEWERSERIEDFIKNRQVVVGMRAEHVLRSWGQPKTKMTVGKRELWTYSKRAVTFEDAVVSEVHN